jgi:hypothetical protein
VALVPGCYARPLSQSPSPPRAAGGELALVPLRGRWRSPSPGDDDAMSPASPQGGAVGIGEVLDEDHARDREDGTSPQGGGAVAVGEELDKDHAKDREDGTSPQGGGAVAVGDKDHVKDREDDSDDDVPLALLKVAPKPALDMVIATVIISNKRCEFTVRRGSSIGDLKELIEMHAVTMQPKLKGNYASNRVLLFMKDDYDRDCFLALKDSEVIEQDCAIVVRLPNPTLSGQMKKSERTSMEQKTEGAQPCKKPRTAHEEPQQPSENELTRLEKVLDAVAKRDGIANPDEYDDMRSILLHLGRIPLDSRRAKAHDATADMVKCHLEQYEAKWKGDASTSPQGGGGRASSSGSAPAVAASPTAGGGSRRAKVYFDNLLKELTARGINSDDELEAARSLRQKLYARRWCQAQQKEDTTQTEQHLSLLSGRTFARTAAARAHMLSTSTAAASTARASFQQGLEQVSAAMTTMVQLHSELVQEVSKDAAASPAPEA